MPRRTRRKSDPRHAPPGQEAALQAACHRVLGQLLAMGRIVDWYHRPDRAPGRGERAGLPDLLVAVRPGLVVACELKTATGRVSPRQAAWLACWGERGAVCRSEGEFVDAMRRWVGC